MAERPLLDNGPMLQQTVTRSVSPAEYEDRAHRAMWEEHARYAMTQNCAKQGVTLIDGAVGKWEPQHLRADDPERVTSWLYRLVGWSTGPAENEPGPV